MHKCFVLGIVVRRLAHYLGSFPTRNHAKVFWGLRGYVSVLELVSKEMHVHFNSKLRLEIHMLGIFEYKTPLGNFNHFNHFILGLAAAATVGATTGITSFSLLQLAQMVFFPKAHLSIQFFCSFIFFLVVSNTSLFLLIRRGHNTEHQWRRNDESNKWEWS